MPRPMSVVVSSSGLENTHSGSTGSAALRSTSTKAMSRTPPTVNAPIDCHESHAQYWPPPSTARISRVIETASSAAPA